jgi:O-antigen ligase
VAHNALLELGVGLGMVGLALFLMTLFAASIIDTRRIVDKRSRSLVTGSLLAVSVPIFLSGHWAQSPAAWLAFGLVGSVGATTSVVRRIKPDGLRLDKSLGTGTPP